MLHRIGNSNPISTMRLTANNLTRHQTLFAETGPNKGVLIRVRMNPEKGDDNQVIAEACKLLVWGDAKEGWASSGRYWSEACRNVEELLTHCPELAKHHYVPSEWVYWW